MLGANAQLAVENFSYGIVADTLTNPVIGGSVWKRYSGTGTPLVYNTTSLSYTGYTSSGIGGSVSFTTGTGSREDANMPTPSFTSGSVYASFLLSVSVSGGTTGDYVAHFIDSNGLTPGTTFRTRCFIKDGSVANTFKLGLSKGSNAASAVFTTADYPLNTPVLVVLKYSFNASVSDTNYAFIFTSGVPAVEPAPDLTTTVTADIAVSDFTKIAGFAIRQGSTGTPSGTIDGIRISNSWNNAPLPVSYKSFTASQTVSGNLLKWATASESNNSGFEVQRSINGSKFATIGFVKGAGNSASVKSYSFVDGEKVSGTSCYRLKQIDFNGKSELSKEVCVAAEKASNTEMSATPNPFNGNLTVNYGSASEGTATVEIIDVIGKVHYNGTESLVKGNNTFNVNTEALPHGVYFVRISQGTHVKTQRIIKK